jgi:hypothetical protein
MKFIRHNKVQGVFWGTREPGMKQEILMFSTNTKLLMFSTNTKYKNYVPYY